MKNSIQTKTSAELKLRTFIVDAKTGRTIKKSRWVHNTIMNQGLNQLAAGAGFGNIFSNISCGSSNQSNQTHNPAVTYTQSTNIITASSGIFASGMVGQLFKYGTGTGGAEYYITGFTDALHVTVDTSATVSTPSQGTIWAVNMTALVAPLYNTATPYADSGNGTVIAAPGSIQLTCKKVFPLQMLPYTVNEIGYAPGGAGAIAGRVVLPSSDVVPPSSLYIIQAVMTFTASPCATSVHFTNTAVNFNISGSAFFNFYCFRAITATSGVVNDYQVLYGNPALGSGLMDSEHMAILMYTTSFSLTPPTITGAATSLNSGYLLPGSGFSASGIGVSTAANSFSLTTAGETCYGMLIGAGAAGPNSSTNEFVYLFDTPQTLPVGSFAGTWTFVNQYTRTLTNP